MSRNRKPTMEPRMFMNYLVGMVGLMIAITMAISPFVGNMRVTTGQAIVIGAVGLICFILVIWVGSGTGNYQLDYEYWPWHYKFVGNLLCLPAIVFGFLLVIVWVIFQQGVRDGDFD